MRFRVLFFIALVGLSFNVGCGGGTAASAPDTIPTINLKCGDSACVK